MSPRLFGSLESAEVEEVNHTQSLLGWTVIGPTGKSTQNDIATVNLLKHDDENLTNMVEKIWKTDFGDAYSVTIKSISAEDQRTLNLLEQTVKLVDGHYV